MLICICCAIMHLALYSCIICIRGKQMGTLSTNYTPTCVGVIERSLYDGQGNSSYDIDMIASNLEFEINCSEAFFLSNGTCLPRCDKWTVNSKYVSTAIVVIVGVSSALRVIFSIISLVASCIKWKQM